MPDHVDHASRVEEAAGNVDNVVDSDNVVPPSTDDPVGATDEALTPPATGGKRPERLPVIVLWLVAVIVIVMDQVTKQWALSALSDGRHTALFGRALGLVLVRNPGAAFSFATGQTWIFALIAFFVVAVIIRVSRNLASRSWAVALGLVLGGAVGNLIDRLLREPGFLRGHVIDFIDYGGYFVGNVADIAIVAAAVGIIVLSLGGWEIDGTRAGAVDNPEVEATDGSTSSADRGTRARRRDRAEAPIESEESAGASTQGSSAELP